MKTLKIATCVLMAICLMSNKPFAQGVYFNLSGGYGLKMSSQNIDYFHLSNYTIDTLSTSYEQINTSLGKGIVIGGVVGYMFNKNIGAEIGCSYLLGSKTKTKQTLFDGVRDNSLYANMARINPSLVIACGFEKINPYAKLGLIVGFGKIVYEDEYTFYNGSKSVEKKVLNGGIALGISSAAGVEFRAHNLFSIYGEVNVINLSYAPVKRELTKSDFNGTDRLPYMTTAEKEVDFVDSYAFGTNTPYLHTEPRKELKENFPFGSVGAVLGLKINF